MMTRLFFAIFGPPQQCAKLGLLQMEVGESVVGLSTEVKNQGVLTNTLTSSLI